MEANRPAGCDGDGTSHASVHSRGTHAGWTNRNACSAVVDSLNMTTMTAAAVTTTQRNARGRA